MKTHVVGTQKNRLNEMVLLSTQSMFKLIRIFMLKMFAYLEHD